MERLLTAEEAAEVLHLNVNTLRNWRSVGKGPASGKIGRRIFYKEQIVLAWRDAQFSPSAA